ncbi:Membrane protein [[Clostridium] ultunense Esp]|uniref:Membrane protein n=1 Tax=[Clostridium] ultunense Esp TaxID=1288971 RepID=M1ZEQ4_9FIRM|nr:hypothetical protein [Schnuerera ultunensis]CCQ96774.1 Membrane protein [[Clostridium] ultunense Esp]SHD75538.1 Membrane protein [[Clostridium] ultunense Esp]
MGRYIKYEIRGSYKFILGVLALVLILTTGIYAYISNAREGSALGATFTGLSVLVIFGTLLTTFLYIVNSFRKELYEDRGYLTFTLPLTGNQILGAKLIVAFMWFVLLGVVIAIYNGIMVLSFSPVKIKISELFSMLKNMNIPYRELVVFGLTAIIGGVSTLILIYFSMALSRVTFRNKKIGGFWFVIFLVLSGIVTYGQVKVIQLLPYYLDLNTFKIASSHMLSYGFNITINNGGLIMNGDLGGTILNIAGFIYSIVIGVLMFLGTGYLIENKIDL